MDAMQTSSIMVVDDDNITREFFDVMLSKLGSEVLTANDAETALEIIGEKTVDLILLDNILPGMTGWEFVEKLKKDEAYAEYRNIPVIMLSAMSSVENKVRGFDLGVEDYVTKPFNFAELFARITAVLRQRATNQQLMQRERSLALIETMNNSLVYFAAHIEDPIRVINRKAEEVNLSDESSVQAYITEVREQSREILTALRALREKIENTQKQREELKLNELSVEKLEQQYRKYRQYVEEIMGYEKERKE